MIDDFINLTLYKICNIMNSENYSASETENNNKADNDRVFFNNHIAVGENPPKTRHRSRGKGNNLNIIPLEDRLIGCQRIMPKQSFYDR